MQTEARRQLDDRERALLDMATTYLEDRELGLDERAQLVQFCRVAVLVDDLGQIASLRLGVQEFVYALQRSAECESWKAMHGRARTPESASSLRLALR